MVRSSVTIGLEIETTLINSKGKPETEMNVPIGVIDNACDCEYRRFEVHTTNCLNYSYNELEPTETSYGYQHDTAGEFRTSWHTTTGSFARGWIKFFDKWFKYNSNKFPYFIGYDNFRNYSIIGQHHHIGLRKGKLTEEQGDRICAYIEAYSPFLMALSANAPTATTKSRRMDSNGFEIERDGSFGTLEVRAWDANYPQVGLTLFEIEKLLAQKALQGTPLWGPIIGHDYDGYVNDSSINDAVTYGFSRKGINPKPYIKWLATIGLDTTKEPIRGILQLAKQGMNMRDYLKSKDITTPTKEVKYIKPLIMNPEKPPQRIIEPPKPRVITQPAHQSLWSRFVSLVG